MKIILIGSSKSNVVIKESKYLADKYLPNFCKIYLYYDDDLNDWSAYLKGFLSYLTDENVILALDDFLISDFIDMKVYNEAIKEMGGDVVCVKLCQSTEEEHEQYPVTTQYSIWNREYLISILDHTNSPWNFERRGSQLFDKKSLLRTCIFYDCNSSTSHRWHGANFSGVKQEDIELFKDGAPVSKIGTAPLRIVLVGYPGSQCIVKASRYLIDKYLPGFPLQFLNYVGKIPYWGKTVADWLSGLDDENIIFTLDDYLLNKPINREVYESALKEMGGDVVCIKLCESTEEEHLEYPVTTQYCIWNREYLIWLLNQSGRPWDFEMSGKELFKKTCLHRPCIYYNTISSISGKWTGINLDGLNDEDLNYVKETFLIPQ